jgi:hypothetical protein
MGRITIAATALVLVAGALSALVALGGAARAQDTGAVPPASPPSSACAEDVTYCVYPGQEVSIRVSSITTHGDCTVAWDIVWGDGSVDEVTTSPAQRQVRVSHTYDEVGTYAITTPGISLDTDPDMAFCHGVRWEYPGGEEAKVQVVRPNLSVTALSLRDIDNTPLRFISGDDHAYFAGNTRVHGTITLKGDPRDRLTSLELEARDEDGTLAKATLAPGVRGSLLTAFGSDGRVSVSTSKLLFLLPSAQAALLDSETNGNVELKVVAGSANGLRAERVFGSVPRLVRYTDANRYGNGRDGTVGGDDWVKPSVRPVAEHYAGNLWGDFSNMNGGRFSPHSTHRTGNDIDGKFAGYAARNASVAQEIIGQLNDDAYGGRISKVFVTFNAPGAQPLACENGHQDANHSGFWHAIQNATLDDGRAARKPTYLEHRCLHLVVPDGHATGRMGARLSSTLRVLVG